MSRNPGNAVIWTDAHIWLALGNKPRPALPASADIEVDEQVWLEFGILDGDAGIGEDRTNDETKHYGWGIGLIKVGRKNYELTRTFSCLEDNAQTRSILWPGSTNTKLLMPKPVSAWLGFDTIGDDGRRERLWTTRPAELTVPSNARNESDITKIEITANIFADGESVLFDRQAFNPTAVTTP